MLLSPDVAADWPREWWARDSEGVAPFDSTFVTRIFTRLGAGTVVEGRASTADGCSRDVQVERFEGRVVGFWFDGLCPLEGVLT